MHGDSGEQGNGSSRIIDHPNREEMGMRKFKIVATGVVTFFIVAVIFIVSFIVQSPNKTNGVEVFVFPISSHGFLVTAGLASGVAMLWVSRRKVRSTIAK
jgi:hypothetical protein